MPSPKMLAIIAGVSLAVTAIANRVGFLKKLIGG